MAQPARRIEDEAPHPGGDTADIVRRVEDDPTIVLTDEKAFDAYFTHVEKEAMAAGTDISTEAARDRIKSAAYSIARKKTAIDNAGKALTEEWRRKTSIVNNARNVVKERFEGLRDRVRQPLTEWETREETRKAEADRLLDLFRNAAVVRADETADDVKARLDEIRGININDEILGPRTEMATDLREDAVKALTEALDRIRKAEAERAELERLRREAQERAETEARERREREAREVEERRMAEVERIARENAEQAAERARKEDLEAAERAQREELDRIEREKQAEIDAANERARKAEAEAQAERDRIAREEAAREAEAKRVAEEQRRREADLEHRSNIMRAAKEALMETAGLTEAKAKAVILQIAAGNVPSVIIHF